jgi:hypothetical protein
MCSARVPFWVLPAWARFKFQSVSSLLFDVWKAWWVYPNHAFFLRLKAVGIAHPTVEWEL